VTSRYPWSHLLLAILGGFGFAVLLEQVALKRVRWLQRLDPRRKKSQENEKDRVKWDNAIVNVLDTTAWLVLIYLVMLDAVTPNVDSATQAIQVVLALLGTSVLYSLREGVTDVGSTYLMP
jgi:hypothetical protein